MTTPSLPTTVRWLPGLLGVWSLATLLTLAVMLTHHSDEPVLFNRYSPLVALMLGGLALTTLACGSASWLLLHRPTSGQRIAARLQTWRAQRWFAPLVLVAVTASLSAIWLFFLGNHLPTYGFLRGYIGLTIIVGALALLFGGRQESGDGEPRDRQAKYLVWAFMACLALVALLTLSFYPALAKSDEAVVFSMARNALETGQLTTTVYRHVTFLPGGWWTLMMAGWLKLAGLSLTTGRLYGLLVSGVALGFVWAATIRLYDRATAWLATLIGAFAFISLNHIRYDVHSALFLSMALFFYSLAQRRERWWLHLLVGFAAGLCLDSNPITYCFGLGFGLLYLRRYLRRIQAERIWFWPPFWSLALGGLLAIGVFVLVRSGVAFAGGSSTGGMFSSYLSSLGDNLRAGVYRKMLREFSETFLTNQPILFGLVVGGLVTASRERTDRVLLALFITWITVILFAYYYFPPYYIVQALPILVILAARALVAGIPRLLHSRAPALMAATILLVGVWLVAAVGNDILRLPATSLEDVVETARQIARIVPEDAVIVAAEPYYFGMIEHRGFVGGAVESILMSFGHVPLEETWQIVSPDAIVFSSKWSTEPAHTPALMAYMSDHDFRVVGCWETESYGHIELWMEHVPPGVTPSDECIQVCNPRLGCGAGTF